MNRIATLAFVISVSLSSLQVRSAIGQLTITEELLRQEVLRLGGDWETGEKPSFVGFYGDSFKPAHYEMLTHLPTITFFAVRESEVDNFSFSSLARVTSLERLEFQDCHVAGSNISVLRNNRNLRELVLMSVTIDDDFVKEMIKLGQITNLSIEEVSLPKLFLEDIKKMKGLRNVHIAGCEGPTTQEIKDFKQRLRQHAERRGIEQNKGSEQSKGSGVIGTE